jgi:hypothetical protein
MFDDVIPGREPSFGREANFGREAAIHLARVLAGEVASVARG